MFKVKDYGYNLCFYDATFNTRYTYVDTCIYIQSVSKDLLLLLTFRVGNPAVYTQHYAGGYFVNWKSIHDNG